MMRHRWSSGGREILVAFRQCVPARKVDRALSVQILRTETHVIQAIWNDEGGGDVGTADSTSALSIRNSTSTAMCDDIAEIPVDWGCRLTKNAARI